MEAPKLNMPVFALTVMWANHSMRSMASYGLSPITRKIASTFYGWRVVAVSFIYNAVNDGTWLFGFAILFLPISRDLSLSKTAISIPFTINRLLTTTLGPLVGYLIDRFSPGTVLFWSGVLAGSGFITLSFTRNYVAFVAIMVGMINLGMMPLIPGGTTAVARWFYARRSLAMGAANAGWPVGFAALPPLLSLGVASVGWRTTAAIIGIGIWLVVIPLSRVLRKFPHEMGLRPDGLAPEDASEARRQAPAQARQELEGLSVRQGLTTARLWLLSLAIGMHRVTITAVAVHLVAILVWKGLPEKTAGDMLGVWGAFMAPALLTLGFVGDRWHKTKIISLGLYMRSFGWLLLITWLDGEVWKLVVIFALLSPDFGVFSVMMALVADWVGLRNYATIRSAVFLIAGLLGGVGPIFAGAVFDRTNSYEIFVWTSFALSVCAATIIWLLPTSPIGRPASLRPEG